MGYKQVGIVEAPAKETVIQRRRDGWGKQGQIAGAAIGGVIGGLAAGAGTGGAATAAGAMAGAAGGASLGGLIGDRLNPGKAEQTAIERRAAATAPQMVESESAEKLKRSISALATQPPEMQQQYMKPLIEAYALSLGPKQGGGVA